MMMMMILKVKSIQDTIMGASVGTQEFTPTTAGKKNPKVPLLPLHPLPSQSKATGWSPSQPAIGKGGEEGGWKGGGLLGI